MRKLLIFNYLFIMTLLFFGEIKVEPLLSTQFWGYKLIHYREGNFTNSGMKEYVAFYREEYPDSAERDFVFIDKVEVFVIADGKVFKSYPLNAFSSEYQDTYKYIITRNKLDFGSWDNFCYVSDYNGNKHDEILIFILSGIGLGIGIYEFNNHEIIDVLQPPPFNTISSIKTESSIFGNKIIISGYETNAGTSHEVEYQWDKKSKKYLITKTIK